MFAGADLLATSKFQNAGGSENYDLDISAEHTMELVDFESKSWGSFSYVDGHPKENGVKAIYNFFRKNMAMLLFPSTFPLFDAAP